MFFVESLSNDAIDEVGSEKNESNNAHVPQTHRQKLYSDFQNSANI